MTWNPMAWHNMSDIAWSGMAWHGMVDMAFMNDMESHGMA